MSEQTMRRVWVNTEKYYQEPYDGMRLLKPIHREIWEFSSVGNGSFHVDIIYSNKTCMRNIEVAVMDEGKAVFI